MTLLAHLKRNIPQTNSLGLGFAHKFMPLNPSFPLLPKIVKPVAGSLLRRPIRGFSISYEYRAHPLHGHGHSNDEMIPSMAKCLSDLGASQLRVQDAVVQLQESQHVLRRMDRNLQRLSRAFYICAGVFTIYYALGIYVFSKDILDEHKKGK